MEELTNEKNLKVQAQNKLSESEELNKDCKQKSDELKKKNILQATKILVQSDQLAICQKQIKTDNAAA